MKTRKILISLLFVLALTVLLGATTAYAADFTVYVRYNDVNNGIEVTDETLVSELKTKIKDKIGMLESEQRLTIGDNSGKDIVLEDSKKLSEYGISNMKNFIYLRKLVTEEKTFTVKSVVPKSEDEAWPVLEDISVENELTFNYETANSTFTKFEATDKNNYYTNIVITYKYDENVKKVVDTITSKLPKDQDTFEIKDLELINYWLNGGTIYYYSGELMSYINYKNFEIDSRAGSGEPLYTEEYGVANFKYNGTTYYVKPWFGVAGEHIIYVPTNTPKEDLMKVAQERIDKYIGKGKAVLSNMGTNPFQDESNEVLAKSSDGNVYKVTMGDQEHYIVIVEDSLKMFQPIYRTSDVLTDISVFSSDGTLPLDTLIQVKKITSGDEYEKIVKILKVTDNEMFDLKLFSNSLNDYITELENGYFAVKIPVTEKFKNGNLVVYYVTDDGKVEEHEVTLTDGYAVFTTNHFSVYTLAEKVTESEPIKDPENNNNNNTVEKGETENNNNNAKADVPKTGDNIITYVIIFLASAVALTTGLVLIRRKK